MSKGEFVCTGCGGAFRAAEVQHHNCRGSRRAEERVGSWKVVDGPARHPQVEYSVDDAGGNERVFKDWDEAAGFALGVACSRGEAALDVLVWDEYGAKAYGGDDAVERYNEDPEASVFERFEIKVNNVGRVP